jgi:hypothetical protein
MSSLELRHERNAQSTIIAVARRENIMPDTVLYDHFLADLGEEETTS